MTFNMFKEHMYYILSFCMSYLFHSNIYMPGHVLSYLSNIINYTRTMLLFLLICPTCGKILRNYPLMTEVTHFSLCINHFYGDLAFTNICWDDEEIFLVCIICRLCCHMLWCNMVGSVGGKWQKIILNRWAISTCSMMNTDW